MESYPINLSENTRFGAVLNLTYTPSRSVRLNGSFTLNNNKIRGEYKNQNFDSDNNSWNARFSGFVKLPLDISWQFLGTLEDQVKQLNLGIKDLELLLLHSKKRFLIKRDNII